MHIQVNFAFDLKKHAHAYIKKVYYLYTCIDTHEKAGSLVYDHSNFELTCKVFKANEGEHFENLDMISKLC